MTSTASFSAATLSSSSSSSWSKETKKLSGAGGAGAGNTRDLIEMETGPLVGQYSCVYDGSSGVLCAGNKAVMFVGNYFLFENKLKIPWDMVRQVSKLDQGVQIWTKDRGGATSGDLYTFTAIRQPGRVWPVLVNLHNDALFDVSKRASVSSKRSIASIPPFVAEREYKRRNSDSAGARASIMTTSSLTLPAIDEQQPSQLPEPSTATPVTSTSTTTSAPSVIPGLTQAQLFEWVGCDFRGGGGGGENGGEIGVGPIPCSHQGRSGHLFACSRGLFFYGAPPPPPPAWTAWFGGNNNNNKKGNGEMRVSFPVGSIHRAQILQASSGIAVISKDGTRHEFFQLSDPDQVWARLVEHHQRNMKHRNQEATKSARHRSLLRTNSDPELHNFPTTSMRDLIPEQPFVQEATTSKTKGHHHKGTLSRHEELSSLLEEEVPILVAEEQQEAELDVDVVKEWSERVVAKQSEFPNLIVDQLLIQNCSSLDDFEQVFLKNQAEYSLAQAFLASLGESQIAVSDWKTQDAGQPKQQTRVVQYIHPVNQPMVPPKAMARKEQRMTRFGDYALLLESKTFVKDIPLTDCFYVEDRMRVETNATANKAVSVSMEFQITFVKSTVFKSIIYKQTKAEFTEFFKKTATYLSQATEKTREAAAAATTPAVAPKIAYTESPPSQPPILVPAMSVVESAATMTTTTTPASLDAWLLPFMAFLALILPSVMLLQLYLLAQLRIMSGELQTLTKIVAEIQSTTSATAECHSL